MKVFDYSQFNWLKTKREIEVFAKVSKIIAKMHGIDVEDDNNTDFVLSTMNKSIAQSANDFGRTKNDVLCQLAKELGL